MLLPQFPLKLPGEPPAAGPTDIGPTGVGLPDFRTADRGIADRGTADRSDAFAHAAIRRIDRLDAPGIAQLTDYWRNLPCIGTVPDRRQIDLAEIAPLAPHLMIVEPAGEDGNWRWRLAGAALAAAYGFEWTGKTLRDVFAAADRPLAAALLDRAAADTQPTFIEGRLTYPGRGYKNYESVLLPILAPDRTTRWLLGALFFDRHIDVAD